MHVSYQSILYCIVMSKVLNSSHKSISESSPVRDITSFSPDVFTLVVLNWLPPASPNGVILSYTVSITLHNGLWILLENTTFTTYTAHNLGEKLTVHCVAMVVLLFHVVPGIPYDVNIIPVNLAGNGEFITTTIFTQEYGTLPVNIYSHNFSTYIFSPRCDSKKFYSRKSFSYYHVSVMDTTDSF